MTNAWSWLVVIWIATLPLAKRWVVWQASPGWHEYESLFFYLHDIALILFLIAAGFYLIKNKSENKKVTKKGWGVIIFIIAALINIPLSVAPVLAIGKTLRLCLYIAAAVIINRLYRRRALNLNVVLWTLAITSLVEAVLAIVQIKIQGSLGLHLIGEPVLRASLPGVSSITVGGIKILRAYGTTLHPNILATWLLVGWWSWLALFNKNNQWVQKIIIISALYIVSLGIVATFSRAAWITLGVVLISGLGWITLRKKYKQIKIVAVGLVVAITALIPMYPLLQNRAEIRRDEPAIIQRMDYDKISWGVIKTNPLGVGLGNQVITSYTKGQFYESGLNQPWLWQPAHNIYLLYLAETGWTGGIVFIFLTLTIWVGLIKKNIGEEKFNPLPYLLTSLIILGLVDHHLVTIANSQGLWWLVIGLSL